MKLDGFEGYFLGMFSGFIFIGLLFEAYTPVALTAFLGSIWIMAKIIIDNS